MTFAEIITAFQAIPCDLGYGWQAWLSWWSEWIAC